jgi:hypothetical protein
LSTIHRGRTALAQFSELAGQHLQTGLPTIHTGQTALAQFSAGLGQSRQVQLKKGRLEQAARQREEAGPQGSILSKKEHQPAYAVNVFVPLVDMSMQLGQPEFVKGSHILGKKDLTVEKVTHGLGRDSRFSERLARCARVQKHIPFSQKHSGSQIEMLTPRQRAGVGVVSEEESDEDSAGERSTQKYQPRSWKSRLRWLTQTGSSGKKLPPVGRFCLIMKGDADKDVGRMGIVSRQTRCMVAIVWKDAKSGRTKERMKQPESLIQLEDGLIVEQDVHGMLWVVRQRGM